MTVGNDAVGGEASASPPRRRRWTTKLAHPGFSVTPCPREECGFPEADGGYCPECGYTFHPPGCPCAEHLARVEEAEARAKRKGSKRG